VDLVSPHPKKNTLDLYWASVLFEYRPEARLSRMSFLFPQSFQANPRFDPNPLLPNISPALFINHAIVLCYLVSALNVSLNEPRIKHKAISALPVVQEQWPACLVCIREVRGSVLDSEGRYSDIDLSCLFYNMYLHRN
jgi:hypothetical protein